MTSEPFYILLINGTMMWQLCWWSRWHYQNHNFLFMYSTRLCLQNIILYNVALDGGEREFGTQMRDLDGEKDW
jgi:hypothetical protein